MDSPIGGGFSEARAGHVGGVGGDMRNEDSIPMNDWTDAETRVERAHQLYEQARWPEAAAELRAAIDINPYNASWHFNLGLTLEAMEDYPRACDVFKAALQLEPDDLETLNCLGVNLTRQGAYGEALEFLEHIEHLDSAYEPSYCNRIITYTEMGRHEDAELMFYLARQVLDECPLCMYNIGNSFYARGNYDRAIQCWQETIRLQADHLHAGVRIAEAFWAKGDLDSARTYYQQELDRNGEDADVLLDYGELLLEIDQLEDAEAAFRRALEVSPDNAAAHYCLGELALRRGKYETALRAMRRSLKLDPEYPGSHAKLAGLLIRKGQIQEGAKHILAELKRCGDDAGMLQELGQLLLEAHLTRHANSVLSRLVALSPEDPYAQHNLAVSYFKMDRMNEGIHHCRRALKLKPEYPLALYNLALAHLKMGQIPRARRYVAKAMTMAPKDDNIRELSKRLGIKGIWAKIRSFYIRRRRRKPQ